MACAMSITSVLGIPATPGGMVTSTIHVTGKVSGTCAPIDVSTGSFDVVVEVDCGVGPVTITTLSSGGTWSVDIATSCSCTKPIIVKASCATDPGCSATFTGALACQPPSDCPAGSIVASVGACNPDGTRTVTATASLTTIPPGTVVAQWFFDGATGPTILPGPANPGPFNVMHNFTPPGPHTIELRFLLPMGCPPLSVTVTGLPPCAVICPEITSVTAVVAADCNDDGTRTVTFDATVTGGPPQMYRWEFGDNTVQNIPGAMGAATSHHYMAPGFISHTVTLTISGPDPSCLDTYAVTVDVPGCGGPVCPTPDGIDIMVRPCTSDGKRKVNFTAEITGSGVTEFHWHFEDNVDTVTTGPTTSRDYVAPSSGIDNHSVTVTTKGPPGCPDQSVTASFGVGPCHIPPPLCGLVLLVLVFLVGAAVALTIFLIALVLCPGLATATVTVAAVQNLVIVLWIAVAVAAGLSALLCWLGWCPCLTRCDWFALTWVALVASFVVALYLSPCCGWNWLAWILGLSYLAVFAYWYAECDPGLCKATALLASALGSVAAVIIAYIAGVQTCGAHWVQTTLTLVVAGLILATGTCVAARAQLRAQRDK